MLDRTKFSYCSLPVLIPKEYDVFARQGLANIIKCLGAALNFEPCTVCIQDYRDAIRFASRLLTLPRTETALHDADIFIFDGDEDEE